MSEAKASPTRLGPLLKRLSDHLDALAQEIHGIEHAIGEELSGDPLAGTENMRRLQRLDFLRQSLEDVALMTLLLSKDHDGDVDAILSSRLRLETTQNMVGGNVMTGSAPASSAPFGEVDLF